MKALWLNIIAAVCITLTTSCGNNHRKSASWLTSDDVHIAVDETFRPIMEEEFNVFGLQYPEATVKPVYLSEHDALKLLVNDSVRACIVTRKLSDAELKIIRSHTLDASQAQFATDAFALIVNKANKDTLITLDEIKGIVSGKITKWQQLSNGHRKGTIKMVFDNQGSSTVRYITDSLNNGKKLSGNVFAQGNNRAVIDLVKKNPDVIGVVGADWLKQKGDSVLSSFKNLDFNVMMVSRYSDPAMQKFVRPYQYYIATAEYPLLRPVYVITTDPRTKSMVKMLYFFLKGQRGQLIICNDSQMLPIMPVQVKEVSMTE